MDDILVELNKRTLSQLLGVLKQQLPQQIRPHNYILNYLIHYDRINGNRGGIHSPRWNLRFYAPRNARPEHCTFVSISDRKDYCITVFTLEETCTELTTCLRLTKRIDWHCEPFALGVDSANFNAVNDVLRERCNNWHYEPLEFIMYMPKEKVMKLPTPSVPSGLCLRPLDVELARRIDDTWSHRYEHSYALIKQSIELNGGVALLREDTQEPIAWIATNDFFTPGFLHTIAEERRKGYGSIVFTQELKRLAEQHNVDLFTFVVCNNKASVELHRQLGFAAVNSVRWIIK